MQSQRQQQKYDNNVADSHTSFEHTVTCCGRQSVLWEARMLLLC